MPFGLKNAGITFQRYIDTLLANAACAFRYLDDIIVESSNESEHAVDAEKVI